jgi:hypothetical protein
MNCEQCQIELEDFLYGELKSARAMEIGSHLAACADCRRVRASLEREAEVFSRYHEQAALEPSSEMWEAVRERIGGRASVARRAESWLARWREWLSFGVPGSLLGSAALRQAAFAAILIAVSVTATALYFSMRENSGQPSSGGETVKSVTPQPEPSVTPTGTPGVPPSNNERPEQMVSDQPAVHKPPKPAPRPLTEDELIRQQLARVEREYQQTIQLLDRRIARRKDNLDPALLAHYQSNLALIDNSIVASRRALREQPKDPIAAQFLLAAYARKVELMEEIAMR